MSLGTRIKECRLKARLSQEKVAELVGVSRQAVTKWESDQSAPNTDNLFRLADVLGTTVDFLISSETDNHSVAEQVYQMFKDEEARKEAELRRQKRLNFHTVLGVLGGYLLIFLIGKLLWTTSDDYTFLGWLSSTDSNADSYLFSWLLHNRLYFYCALFSVIAAAIGRRRLALTTLGGFVLGLPLGEYLGNLPGLVPEMYHMGWAIWGLIFLGSIFFGLWLQRFQKEQLHFRNRKLQLWCTLIGIYIIAVIVFVLLNIPPAYY